MDVSNILASHAEKYKSITVEKENPLETDPGLLTVTDPNPIDEESYNENLEEHLQSLARDGVQALFSELFSLPVKQSPDGPLAQLPPPKTQLPRSKPLPKPRAKTKWEMFAAAKGISHKKRDKKVWDEEKQDWVNRWGRDGKNREKEDQWLSEVPLNADPDFDPRKAARDARKDRISKNKKQHAQNVARAVSAAAASGSSERDARKNDIQRTLATTRVSTASMGKFDKKLEGEKKLRGIKRKFDPTEASASQEAKSSLALLSRIDSDAKKMRKDPTAEDSVLNVRKAVRFASKGKGAHALAREGASSKGARGKKGKR